MAWNIKMADQLREAGLKVRELPGWKTRGHGPMRDVRGILCHGTVGPKTGNYPSENVVFWSGRPNLPPPLGNLGLARDGTWIVGAAGLAYHAGAGGPLPGIPQDMGNHHLLGVEAETDGYGNDWTDEQFEAYPRGCAALITAAGLDQSRVWGHYEWTTRKIDPNGWPGRMSGFRATVAEWINEGAEMNEKLDKIIALLEKLVAEDMPKWMEERVFNRVLSDSAGVPGENFDGKQYAQEQEVFKKLAADVAAIKAATVGKTV